jgi:hypothetical protein
VGKSTMRDGKVTNNRSVLCPDVLLHFLPTSRRSRGIAPGLMLPVGDRKDLLLLCILLPQSPHAGNGIVP